MPVTDPMKVCKTGFKVKLPSEWNTQQKTTS